MKEVMVTKYRNLLHWQSQTPSTKFLNMTALETYLTYLFRDDGVFLALELRTSSKIKRLRFDCYIRKQKTIMNFCKEVVADKDKSKTIICYGNANFRHNMRGRETCPKKTQFVKMFKRMGYQVYMTSEFNTSQICSCCQEFQRLKGCKTARNSYKIRKCQTITCRMIWNRDVNAAINITNVGRSMILTGSKPVNFSTQLPPKKRIKKRGIVLNLVSTMRRGN